MELLQQALPGDAVANDKLKGSTHLIITNFLTVEQNI